jgi:hypothetical protein
MSAPSSSSSGPDGSGPVAGGTQDPTGTPGSVPPQATPDGGAATSAPAGARPWSGSSPSADQPDERGAGWDASAGASSPPPYAPNPAAPAPAYASGGTGSGSSTSYPSSADTTSTSPYATGSTSDSPYGPASSRGADATTVSGDGPSSLAPETSVRDSSATDSSSSDTYRGPYASGGDEPPTAAYPSSGAEPYRVPDTYSSPDAAGSADRYGSPDPYGSASTTAIGAPRVEPMAVPAAAPETPATAVSRRDPAGRAIAGIIGTLLGVLLVGGALYLLGEFGSRVAAQMLSNDTEASVRDVILTALGALLLLVAVCLNGWTPWATLLPGIVLTAVGVWSVVFYDGADRVATFLLQVFGDDNQAILTWGVTAWVLGLGVALLGASIAAIIARAAGRTRGRP